MVLYYGLLALETANNTVAAATATASTSTIPGIASSRMSLSGKQKYLSNSIEKMPSSSNSWIYTEDLRKRFEERYADYRYVFVPVYFDPKSSRRNHSTSAILPQKIDRTNSWMYSRSLHDHLFYSTSKISLPLTTTNVTNHGFMRDEIPVKKNFKTKLFKRSSSTKDKSATNLSLSSLLSRPFASSTSSFSTINNLVKHRSNDLVEEDDEGVDDENHSAPLIKHDINSSMVSSSLSTSRTLSVPLTDNNTTVNPTANSDSTFSTSNLLNTKPPIKRPGSHKNKLTRLRSFFFKSSSPSSFSRAQQQQPPAPHPMLSSSSLSNRISRT